jgi:hypothetical protein
MDIRTLNQRCRTIPCSPGHVRLRRRRRGHQTREATWLEAWAFLGYSLGKQRQPCCVEVTQSGLRQRQGSLLYSLPPLRLLLNGQGKDQAMSGFMGLQRGGSGGASERMGMDAWLHPEGPRWSLEHSKAGIW